MVAGKDRDICAQSVGALVAPNTPRSNIGELNEISESAKQGRHIFKCLPTATRRRHQCKRVQVEVIAVYEGAPED